MHFVLFIWCWFLLWMVLHQKNSFGKINKPIQSVFKTMLTNLKIQPHFKLRYTNRKQPIVITENPRMVVAVDGWCWCDATFFNCMAIGHIRKMGSSAEGGFDSGRIKWNSSQGKSDISKNLLNSHCWHCQSHAFCREAPEISGQAGEW